VISLISSPPPTQGNTNTEEIGTNIHASSGIRTHDYSVPEGKNFNASGCAAEMFGSRKSWLKV
jgi:hypothetical protein